VQWHTCDYQRLSGASVWYISCILSMTDLPLLINYRNLFVHPRLTDPVPGVEGRINKYVVKCQKLELKHKTNFCLPIFLHLKRGISYTLHTIPLFPRLKNW
jgi:hypothetical protein